MSHFISKKLSQKKGFTLFVAIITTSMLLIVSFIVANIALKQLLLSFSNQESQYAFYNADSGVECAVYWDTHSTSTSPFSTSTPGFISCNSQTITTNSQLVPDFPPVYSVIGGGDTNPTSIFSVNLPKGCVIVQVTKNANGGTTINSRGYNTCNVNSDRRFERGITLSY